MQDWWRYEQWGAELETVLLRERQAGTTLTFFVDDGELHRHFSSSQEQPVESLVRAVGSKCQSESRSDLFGPVKRMMATWRLGDQTQPPPCLPLLALTVVAATEMRLEGGFSARAFYPRLVDLLKRGGLHVTPEQLSHSFDDVPPMWKALARWLERDASRGVLTLTPHAKFTRIGYSISQAIIRGSDRARLTTFFQSIGLQPNDPIDEGQLLTALRLWSTRGRGFTKRFEAAVNSDEALELVLPTLVSLAATWDGHVVATSGRRFLLIGLSLDLDEWSADWGLRVQQGLDADTLTFSDGSTVQLTVSEDGFTLYNTRGSFPPVRTTIGHKFDAEGRSTFAMYKPKAVTVLAYDLREARWIESAGIEPFTECVLVVSARRYPEVQSILRRAADDGWVEIRPDQTSSLIPGHVIVRNVSFNSREKFESAMSLTNPDLGEQIRPDPAPVPRLANGLKIDLGVSAGDHYIAGGEPDLILPLGETPRKIEVSLDGVETGLTTSDFPVPLRAITNLASAKHTVVADGRTLSFYVVDHLPDVSNFVRRSRGAGVGDWTDMLSEVRPNRRGTLVSVYGSATVWAIEYTGAARKVEKPPIPTWFGERGVGNPRSFAPVLDDRLAWLARTDGSRIIGLDRISSREPHFGHLDADSDALWQMIEVDADRFRHALLPIYLKAWKAKKSQ